MRLTKKIVRELLDYDRRTGALTWKFRARKWCKSDSDWKRWNNRHAGKPAFTGNDGLYHSGSVLCFHCAAHQVIWLWMTGLWPTEVDHADGDGLNNRWPNLDDRGHHKNIKNQKRRVTNSSGANGVRKRRSYFEARICDGYKHIHLGTFATFKEAVAARAKADRQYGFSARHGSA